MDSISFDRAAEFYDATRGFPEGVANRVAISLLSALSPGASLLEIGVGTGRIAIPLSVNLADVTGVDISPRMLARLRFNLPDGIHGPDLVLGDGVKLPFPGGTFDAVYIVHVIHLIPKWQLALTEARRSLKPGGVFILGYESRQPDSPLARLRMAFREFSGIDNNSNPVDFTSVQAELERTGAQMDRWVAASWVKKFRVRKHIQDLEEGIYSSTWRISPDSLPGVIDRLRGWAVQEFGSLDRDYEIPREFIWERYRWW